MQCIAHKVCTHKRTRWRTRISYSPSPGASFIQCMLCSSMSCFHSESSPGSRLTYPCFVHVFCPLRSMANRHQHLAHGAGQGIKYRAIMMANFCQFACLIMSPGGFHVLAQKSRMPIWAHKTYALTVWFAVVKPRSSAYLSRGLV